MNFYFVELKFITVKRKLEKIGSFIIVKNRGGIIDNVRLIELAQYTDYFKTQDFFLSISPSGLKIHLLIH